MSGHLRPVRGGSICARPRVGMIGSGCGVGGVVAASGVTAAASASATWRAPVRIEGQHGAELNLAVLSRRRAPHRARQHACRASILPRAGFVYAAPAMTGRSPRGLAACSCACGAAARSSCATAAIAGRSTATVIAPHRRAARRCTERADAGSKPGEVGGCMPRGWPGIGRSWLKVPTASALEWQMAGPEK